jgi:release factor glutamine methyltransferase
VTEQSLQTILRTEAERMRKAGIPSPMLEVQLLAAFSMNLRREEVILRLEQEVSYEVRMAIEALVDRRIAGEPMAYIRGVKEFWSLEFRVDSRVMIPRPDTETLVQCCLDHAALRLGREPRRVVDVGTGSGAVACALARELEGATVLAVDISDQALQVARSNAEALGLGHRIRFLRCDLLAPFRPGPRFDIMAANLPYIPGGGIDYLPEGIRDHEPRLALDGGKDGLEVIGRLLYDAHLMLAAGGMVALEVEDTQVEAVRGALESNPAYGIQGVEEDMAGFKRVLWAQKT